MHILSKSSLRAFGRIHPESKGVLDQWYRLVKKSRWRNFAEVKQCFATADWYKDYVIFDLGGNKYRLIASIHFNRGKLFIRNVLTHADYSRGKWKDI